MYVPNIENFFHDGTKRSVEEILKTVVPMQEKLFLKENDISGGRIYAVKNISLSDTETAIPDNTEAQRVPSEKPDVSREGITVEPVLSPAGAADAGDSISMRPDENALSRLNMTFYGGILHIFSGGKRLGTVRVVTSGRVRNGAAVQPKGQPVIYKSEGGGEFVKEYRLAVNGFWIVGAVYREWWIRPDANGAPRLRRFEVAAVRNFRTPFLSQ